MRPVSATECPVMSVAGSDADVAYLRSVRAVRERSRALYDRALGGRSDHFRIHPERLDAIGAYVLEGVVRPRPTNARVPHGRLRHFDVGGRRRTRELDDRLAGVSPEERVRAKIDLVALSVLLDAGAGDAWTYREGDVVHRRSEGLAIASYDAFVRGAFANDGASLRVEADRLASLDAGALATIFQVTPENPLAGLSGRARLAANLAQAMRDQPDVFGPSGRPGGVLDVVGAAPSATDIVALVLRTLARVWPSSCLVAGEPIGDAGVHPALGEGVTSVVPFHKLAQWLAYSLVEPLSEGGVRVRDIDALTGLAEYRNGGLFLDLGALEVRPEDAARTLRGGDEIVVEWRALTVSLLDELHPRLQLCTDRFAPGEIEALTWSAGRRAAMERRPNGAPPLRLELDGTVF